ncbi:hypothetical protein [Streptomyces sp. SID4982]|uniref:hypothetical protein n=1 Tax=Streptomyces sp. SID4982 TaxID=2690291 RepID=UPI00136CE44F|nr:hypothetical protein [Streptomyces sp. SID4982]MYS15153.1 hypothetical protein [Streptomyces sp. SID4982]
MAKSQSAGSPLQGRIEAVIREFPFGNYGLDEVDIALHDYPDDQEWAPDLATAVLAAIEQGHAGATGSKA